MKGGKKTDRKNPIRKENQANIVFPVSRIIKMLKEGNYGLIISIQAGLSLSAILEAIVREVLDNTVDIVKNEQKLRIYPKHIEQAVKIDYELANFFEQNGTVFGIQHEPKRRKFQEEEEEEKNQKTQKAY